MDWKQGDKGLRHLIKVFTIPPGDKRGEPFWREWHPAEESRWLRRDKNGKDVFFRFQEYCVRSNLPTDSGRPQKSWGRGRFLTADVGQGAFFSNISFLFQLPQPPALQPRPQEERSVGTCVMLSLPLCPWIPRWERKTNTPGAGVMFLTVFMNSFDSFLGLVAHDSRSVKLSGTYTWK